MQIYEDAIIDIISVVSGIEKKELPPFLGKPKETNFGDYSFAMFAIAKENNVTPVQAAQMLATGINQYPAFANHKLIAKAQAAGPFVNFFVNQTDFIERIITKVRSQKEDYGSQIPIAHYHYVLDYSAPNIAKPFGIGHLRSTVIGGSIKKILEHCGHRVIGLNYIGDWGTQFGKVIWAFKHWGSEDELQKNSVKHLLDLYIKFHEEAEKPENTPKLEDEAREIFAQLEKGNAEYTALWQRFRDLSIAEFDRIYKLMNVEFEEVRGEAYYNDKMQAVIDELEAKGLLTLDDGAKIVDFKAKDEKSNLPNVIITKTNGASTYILRDIASAKDRIESFGADFLLYEVGQEQKLHFSQLKAILALMGYEWSERIIHIDHGLYRFNDAKMSTRKGNIVLMEDVLNESIERVRKIIHEKNPQLAQSAQFEEVARQVGVGAVMFFDLMNDRVRDVSFSWERVLDFSGESGPYIQYTHARISSILQKYDKKLPLRINYAMLGHDLERKLCLQMNNMPEIIDACAKSYKPHTLARYVLDLAQLFNEYYANQKIISENEEVTAARIALISAVKQTIENSLRLLGIDSPQQM